MSEDKDKKDEVVANNNIIYFYVDTIKTQHILDLSQLVQELNDELIEMELTHRLHRNTFNIFLHINSSGGSFHDGLAGVDIIENSLVPVNTVIEGYVASAASFMSVVGKRRYIHKHSYVTIHQLSSEIEGKYQDIEVEKKNLDKNMKLIYELYERKTKLTKAQLKSLLKKDLQLDATDCIKYGIVDEIYPKTFWI